MAKTYEYKLIKADQLHAYEKNSRKHSEWHIKQIKDSILEFGFIAPVTVDENNEIIAGHGRVLGAMAAKMEMIPCVVAEGLSVHQRKALVIADNRLGDVSDWDYEMLMSELKELAVEDYNLALVGFEDLDLNEILQDDPPEPEKKVVQQNPPANNFAPSDNQEKSNFKPNNEPTQAHSDIDQGDMDKAQKHMERKDTVRNDEITVCCPNCGIDFILRP